MQSTDDSALLRQYAEERSDEAFGALVARHINLVYSVALRQVGNPDDAEEITQVVFIILAKKATDLRHDKALSSWLFQATRLTANNFVRSEIRRRRREQEAHMQSIVNESGSNVWESIAPLLDTAVGSLNEKDRRVIVLRFYEGRNLREVGVALDTNEDAAKMRVNRAIEKLRRLFTKRGFVMPAAVLMAAISANSVCAAPATLAKTTTAVAVASGATASASTLTLVKGALKIMAWSKTKTAIAAGAILLLALGGTTVTVVKNHERKIEKLWRMNKDVPTAKIDQLPPLFKILPTKFDPPWINGNSGSNSDKFVGARVRIHSIAAYAYGFPEDQICFATKEPTNRFDYVATLPRGNREALQQALKTRFGFVGHVETETMDVLLLKVDHPNAPGLKPPIPGKADEYYKPGVFNYSN